MTYLSQIPSGLPKDIVYRRQIGRPLFPIHKITEYLADHPDNELSLSSLAALVHLSACYFGGLFKNTTGWTVHDYVLNRQLETGYRLLARTDLPISQIANNMGFAEESRLIRCFKAAFGLTPGTLSKRPHKQGPAQSSASSSAASRAWM